MHRIFEKARKNMVECQIRPSHVTDPGLLEALGDIPRERFIPPELRPLAYADRDIPLSNGRALPAPVTLARLIEAARVKKTDIVLNIGCGTGYSSALLGRLAGMVIGLEPDPPMAQEADRLLHELGCVNAVILRQENLRDGYPQQGPYDVILLNGAVPAVPETLQNQLSLGGRLVAVLSDRPHLGTATLTVRENDGFSTTALFDAVMPSLPTFEAPHVFVL